jgi:hypothetical protein
MTTSVIRPFPALLVFVWATCLVGILLLPQSIVPDDDGDVLIRNTVRLALAFWTIAVALMLTEPRFAPASDARLAWTLACGAYLIHVGVAFECAHRWSHFAAFEHVKEVGGLGEGIYVNYFFTLLWTADAIWWWVDSNGYRNRPRWLGWAIHGFMVFMIVNGVVIFENGPIRWIGGAVLLGLAWLFWNRMERGRQAASG